MSSSPRLKIRSGDDARVKEEFAVQAKLLGLDELADPRSSEPLTDRLWRRYGANAFEMLETVRENPRNADRLLEHAEYLRCEIEQAGRCQIAGICRADQV
jgi:hypothetical protein